MLGLLKMCYTCLGMNNKELIDVSKLDFDSITLIYKLKVCVSSELEESSSKQICSNCIKQLRISYRFREMVLLSQEALDKHKNEIMSGTYVLESKINQLKMDINNHFVDPEYVIVKQELTNANSPVCSRRRRLKTKNMNEDDDQYFPPEITADDSDSDYFLSDLKSDKKNTIGSTNDTSNFNELDEIVKIDSDVVDEYQCMKCNVVLKDPNQHHSCDGCDSDKNSAKEEKDSKETTRPPGKRGRPRKRLIPKPDLEYECYHCSMIFNKRWKLQKHITRVHSDSKKYVCTYCNKGFKQSYHLREHLTSHTGERNYKCSFCDKTFQRISSMRRHIRSHEAAPGQKTKRTPFLCTVCGKSFPFSNGVQRHMRIHLGIKNHECNTCHRRFTQSTHLHVHMRTHTGEKPYVCDTCGESFSLNVTLQKHMAIHQDRTNLLDCKKLTLDGL